RAGWKYVWVTEHHFLTEYSHLSAPEVFLGYLACATERIHLGSGIFNLNPTINHPMRLAERVAMLDHLTDGRFECGTGRGPGSIKDMEPRVRSYKDNIGKAEPVGDYVNDNVMLTNGVVCLEDGRKARELACRMGISYLQSLVFYYHDTFPAPEGLPVWPQEF